MSTPTDPGLSPSKIKPCFVATDNAALDAVSSIQLLGSPSFLPINTSLEQTEMIFDLPDVKREDCENNQDSNSEVKDWDDLKKFVIHMGEYKYKCSLCGQLNSASRPGPSHLLYHIESMHFRNVFTHTCSICQKYILNHHMFREHKSRR